MPDQKPTVGRIVHYVSYGTPGGEYSSVCRAAIIAGVPEGKFDEDYPLVIDLVVLNPTGLFFNKCPHHEGDSEHVDATPGKPTYRGGTWHWPERV